jgi:hypothetical protein
MEDILGIDTLQIICLLLLNLTTDTILYTNYK